MPWYGSKDATPREQCPCCGYITLPQRGVSLICPICFWEDDAFVGDRPDEQSLCNKMTLRQGRANFVAFGACDRAMLIHVKPPEQRAKYARKPLPTD